ncbi:MAG: hypothetical protein ACJ746_24875 [Bryobacteraceae bacterium]
MQAKPAAPAAYRPAAFEEKPAARSAPQDSIGHTTIQRMIIRVSRSYGLGHSAVALANDAEIDDSIAALAATTGQTVADFHRDQFKLTKDEKHYFVAHANERQLDQLTPDDFADALVTRFGLQNGTSIKLVACSTGSKPEAFAGLLMDALRTRSIWDVKIAAAKDLLHYNQTSRFAFSGADVKDIKGKYDQALQSIDEKQAPLFLTHVLTVIDFGKHEDQFLKHLDLLVNSEVLTDWESQDITDITIDDVIDSYRNELIPRQCTIEFLNRYWQELKLLSPATTSKAVSKAIQQLEIQLYNKKPLTRDQLVNLAQSYFKAEYRVPGPLDRKLNQPGMIVAIIEHAQRLRLSSQRFEDKLRFDNEDVKQRYKKAISIRGLKKKASSYVEAAARFLRDVGKDINFTPEFKTSALTAWETYRDALNAKFLAAAPTSEQTVPPKRKTFSLSDPLASGFVPVTSASYAMFQQIGARRMLFGSSDSGSDSD